MNIGLLLVIVLILLLVGGVPQFGFATYSHGPIGLVGLILIVVLVVLLLRGGL